MERWGLDYCCGGKKPLGAACEERNLDVEAVVQDLFEADAVVGLPETDWTQEPMADLCDHVVHAHHGYLRKSLPRLTGLIEKVRAAHGDNHPELRKVETIFREFREELELHMMKEEQILFPFIKTLETSGSSPSFHCGSLRNPIQVMEAEHDSAGAALEKLRSLTDGYRPPENACNTYRAMLDGLAELEADMHVHVHLENNVLFPRATQREEHLATR
jgi:regulator of cell morphogenesis and NO signaling